MSHETVPWRRLALPVFGPTALVSIGQGAIFPILALSARELGASVATAALVVALIGLGNLVGDLPAGVLAARMGEKRALVGACVVDALALVGAYAADTLLALAVSIFLVGLAGAVLGLARQAYLTEAVPHRQRARAMSTLGGTFRIGLFVGPFIGAAVISVWDLRSAYLVAAGTSLAGAALALWLPDLGGHASEQPATRGVLAVLAAHRRVLLTLGVGVLALSAVRATRLAIVPLWAEAQGIDAATTSVIFGLAAAVDMLLFFPGGAIMDRFGRAYVAVPSLLVVGTGLLVLPLTSGPVTVGLVACLMGLGNGISAGIVLTLGADAAPTRDRSKFLGGWRLCADLGNALGPLVISGVGLVAPLAVAAVTMAVIAFAGAGWLARWVPLYAPGEPARRHEPAPEP